MKVSFPQYPIDLILCLSWSILLFPVALLGLNDTIQFILGLPTILFIPGYIIVFVLFPTIQSDKGISTLERLALSFGLSIAIVPLLGLGLNYTMWGIRLQSILTAIVGFIVIFAIVGMIRWYKTAKSKRFIISFEFSFPTYESKLDKALSIILAASIIIAAISLIYVIITPKTGEKFTEFYILGPNRIADKYPQNLSINETTNVIVGVVNHEYKKITYTIELWAINQSMIYNQTSMENETKYHDMWFIDAQQVILNHTDINIEQSWQPQWEYNWSFSLQKTGNFKLCFLLFIDETDTYKENVNYVSIAKEKLDTAYRSVHLWLSVTS